MKMNTEETNKPEILYIHAEPTGNKNRGCLKYDSSRIAQPDINKTHDSERHSEAYRTQFGFHIDTQDHA